MSAPDEEVTVEGEDVTVKKSLNDHQFETLAVVFDIRSSRGSEVGVSLTDAVPEGVPVDDIGFHPEYGGEHWRAGEGEVVFERAFEPGEQYTTVYGVRDFDDDDGAVLLTEPHVEIVSDAGSGGVEGIEDLVSAADSEVVRAVISGDRDTLPGLEDEVDTAAGEGEPDEAVEAARAGQEPADGDGPTDLAEMMAESGGGDGAEDDVEAETPATGADAEADGDAEDDEETEAAEPPSATAGLDQPSADAAEEETAPAAGEADDEAVGATADGESGADEDEEVETPAAGTDVGGDEDAEEEPATAGPAGIDAGATTGAVDATTDDDEAAAEADEPVEAENDSGDEAIASLGTSDADDGGPDEEPADADEGLGSAESGDDVPIQTASPVGDDPDDESTEPAAEDNAPTAPDEVEEPADPATAGDDEAEPEEEVTVPARGGVARVLAKELRAGNVSYEDRRLLMEELLPEDGSTDARIQSLQTRVSDLAAYTEALEAFLDEEGGAEAVIGRLEDEVASLERELQDVEETADRVAATVDAVEGTVEELSGDVESGQRRLDVVEEDVEAVSTDVDDIEDDLEDVEDEVEDALAAVSRLEDDVGGRLDGLEDDVADIFDELDDLATFRDRLSSVFGEGGGMGGSEED